MKNAKSMYTLQEWESMCDHGQAFEPDSPFPCQIPIECPGVVNYNSPQTRFCKAKLWDVNELIPTGTTVRRKIKCYLCEWTGTRSIGKEF